MLPTPYSVGVKRHTTGAEDGFGNAVEGWDAPIYVGVYSIAPASSTEPFEPGRTAVITGLTVLAPGSVNISARDRVLVDGDEYEVVGDIADWNRGPFGFMPGIQINLERVEG